MKATKKLCSAFLVLAMVLSMVPAASAAASKFAPDSMAAESKVLYAKYSTEAAEDGKLTEAQWQTNATLDGVKFGAIWDSGNLYLGFEGTATPTAITLNGVTVTRSGVAGESAREICIPLSAAKITISDYDLSAKLSMTLGASKWEGTVVFDSVESTPINQFDATKTETKATATYDKATEVLHLTGSGDSTVLVRHSGAAKATTSNTIAVPLKIIDPANPPVAFEFDCRVDYLPVYKRNYASTTGKETCYGLFFVVGGKIVNTSKEVADPDDAGMTFGITNLEQGLALAVRATNLPFGESYTAAAQPPQTILLDKEMGQQFHLRLNYNAAEDTIDVFVDDVFKGHIKYAQYDNPFRYIASQGYLSHLQVGAYTFPGNIASGDNAFDITVSHLQIGAHKVVDPAKQFDSLTFDAIKGRNDSQAAVYYDLDLVNSIPGPLTVPLTWTSSNPAVISNTGKVSEVTKDEQVTLTAALTGNSSMTKSFTVTVKGPEVVYASPATAEASYAKTAVSVDGKLTEIGWRLGGRVLGGDNALVAEYGFQWTQTHLFAAVDFAEAVAPVALTLNGHTFTIENGKVTENGADVAGAKLSVGSDALELSLPFTAIGLGSKVSSYGKSLPVSVTVNGTDGPAKTLTLTDVVWFTAVNRHNSPKYSSASQVKVTGNTPVAGYQGATKLDNGWRIYDLYNPEGANPAGIRTYVMYQNPGFDDRNVGTRLEFDFRADKMPIGIWDDPSCAISAYSNYGFTFAFGTKYDDYQQAISVTCGVVNTEDGLVLAMRNDNGHKVNLDKKVGDSFNLAVEWNLDNSLDVYVDGVKKGTMSAAGMLKKGASNQSVVFNVIRDPQKAGAADAADSYDVTISNLAFGNSYNEPEGLLGRLTFADIANGNPAADQVTQNLKMTGSITDGLLDNTYPVTWTSSDESAVTSNGVVTRPEQGVSFATLTATADGQSKSFDVVVLGKTMDNSKALQVQNDIDPAHGAGESYDQLLFTLDINNNSIIAVQDSSKKTNLVTLTDGDDKSRLNAESLTLWASDDNTTYTQIRDFKLVHIGKKTYLYGFETQAKYIKVHYTQYKGEDACFIGAFGTMITAGYDSALVKGEAAEYTVTNSTTVKYDATLAVDGFTGDTARLRVFDKDGNLLYHYVDGGKVCVRYPELAIGSSAKVYVQQAPAGAIELASKENVYEITYGNREVVNDVSSDKVQRWITSLPAGTRFPDGSTLAQETVYAMGSKLNISTDGGRTWTLHSKVVQTAPEGKPPVERVGGSGAFTFDHHTGRMFFQTYYVYKTFDKLNITVSHCEQMIIASDNGGKTWYLASTLPRDVVNDPQSAYMLTYSGGTVLSSYDGKGSNVDMVFPMGAQYNNMGGFCCRVAYTKDAGATWQLSESLITYKDIATNSENGCSEAYIQDRGDGVLVLYTRCQAEETDHFGVSYSLDQGVTWMEEATESKMYAVNTQATIADFPVNGKDADLSIWGGSTALGGRSYIRNPLNVAVSTNGSGTYRNIQNLFFESEMASYGARCYTVTNPTAAKVNESDMLITFQDLSGARYYLRMFVQDFDKWFTRTRGGYDNFEHGTTKYEGWVSMSGSTEPSTVNARDKYSMKVNKDTVVTRTVPYLQNGTVSMDLYVPAGASFTFELQSAFSNVYADVAMPIGLRAENGKLYMNNSGKAIANLQSGWNTLTFDLELTNDAATLSVNGGKAVKLDVLSKAGDYVGYLTFNTQSDIWVDEILITSELEPVLEATAADKAEADAVLTQIKALANLPAEERVAKVDEVRKAYAALTQTQQDLIDRDVVGKTGVPVAEAMVNYYEVLMDYAGTVTFKDVSVSDWYYDAVAYATANGIMSGYSADKFGPNDTLSRAMVVQLLYNKEGQPLLNGLKHSFSDVPADQWFNNAVTWGNANKVVSGFGGGVFKPNDNVTIEQVAVILRNYSGAPNGDGDLGKVGNHSDWAADALKWAVAEGILDNVPFTNATENATRAQAAQMLTNYLRNI